MNNIPNEWDVIIHKHINEPNCLEAISEIVELEKEKYVETVYSHYKQSGGYTKTAAMLIQKVTGQKWERDKEIDELKEQLAAKDEEIVKIKATLTERNEQLMHINVIEDKQLREAKQRIKELEEAGKEIIHLHMCEQEGICSGQPTIIQWVEAVDKLSKLLYK